MQQDMNTAQSNGTFVDRYLPAASDQAGDGGAVLNLDISTIRAMLWRQRYILGGATILALLAAVLVTMLAKPIYSATSTLRVQNEGPALIEGEELLNPYIASTEVPRYLETLGGVLASRSMALRVVSMLELEDDPRLFQNIPIPADPANARQAATAILMQGVDIEVPFNSRILSVNVNMADPALAAEIANAYAEAFVAEDVSQGIEANAYAREFLEGQIEEARQQLQDAEVRANDYARANRLVGQSQAAGGMSRGNGSSDQQVPIALGGMAQMNQALGDARASRIEAEQRWRTISGVPAGQLLEVQQNSSMQSLQTRRAALTSELADLRERYRDDYPEIGELQAQIATLDGQISALGNEIKNSIRDAYVIAGRQEDALSAEVDRLSRAALDEQDRRVEYNLINRDVAALRLQLESLLLRYNGVSAASNLRSSGVVKLDDAITPVVPTSPNLWKNILVGLVLGLGLAIVLAIVREALDDRVRNLGELERKLRLRGLGQTPYTSDVVGDEIAEPLSALSESYSSIRASIDFALEMRGNIVVQFTSTQPVEGKTTTALALAEKYASLGRKVLLVDLDLRRPRLGKTLVGSAISQGIMDVLHGRTTKDEAIISLDKFDLLAVRKVPDETAAILSSGLVGEFIEKVRPDYDVILIDSSPVLGIADAPLLSRFVDAVVFIVEANRASSRQSAAAIRRLHDVNANVIGAVLTKYRALNAGDPYSYQYRYYSYDAETE